MHLNVSEVNVDDVLTLQIPHQTWDYTGQKGFLDIQDLALKKLQLSKSDTPVAEAL
ncbi:MAG: hypothetical protein IKI66_00185 [Bacteroidales bacterium]|nr:hypothetical protein [Bacteroidales bacterium]